MSIEKYDWIVASLVTVSVLVLAHVCWLYFGVADDAIYCGKNIEYTLTEAQRNALRLAVEHDYRSAVLPLVAAVTAWLILASNLLARLHRRSKQRIIRGCE